MGRCAFFPFEANRIVRKREGGSSKQRQCVFCLHEFKGGPSHIRSHVVLEGKRQVKPCVPHRNWSQRHKEVVAVLKSRLAVEAASEAKESPLAAQRGKKRHAEDARHHSSTDLIWFGH